MAGTNCLHSEETWHILVKNRIGSRTLKQCWQYEMDGTYVMDIAHYLDAGGESIAWITLQKSVSIATHACTMIPERVA